MSKLLTIQFAMIAILTAVQPLASRAESPPVFQLQFGTEGTGPGQFIFGDGIADAPSGDVYVADLYGRIQQFDSNGGFINTWGTDGTGDGQFRSPTGLAVDNLGNVYVADQGNHRIQKFTADGTFITAWGTQGSGPGQFQYPFGAAWHPLNGRIYVTGQLNSRVQVFTTDGNFLFSFGEGLLVQGYGITIDLDGLVYVVVTNASNISAVWKFTADGAYLGQWGSGGTGDGQFKYPTGVATDAQGNVYVADKDNHRIQKFTSDGTFLTKWGQLGSAPGRFNLTYGVAVNDNGDIYVTDHYNHRVQKFGTIPTPAARTSWGRIKTLYR